MSTETLTATTPLVEDDAAFECNVLIIGMLAKAYGQHSPSTPMRGWGGSDRNPMILWDGKSWAAAPNRKNGRNGVRVTVRDQDSGVIADDFWVAFEDLDRVRVHLPVEDF